MEAERTLANGTMTTHGFIPHVKYKGYELPILLKINKHLRFQYQKPAIINDCYLYVMPDGTLYAKKTDYKKP